MISSYISRKKTFKTAKREDNIVRRTLLFKIVNPRSIKSLELVYKEENILLRIVRY